MKLDESILESLNERVFELIEVIDCYTASIPPENRKPPVF